MSASVTSESQRTMTPEPEGAERPLLSVEGIDKGFPGVQALRDVSFDLYPGEIHGLVGGNGAGKSTLMRILTGVYQPDAGTIRFQGNEVRLESPARSRALGINMVYQDTRLVSDLDVGQNIWLGGEPTTFGPFVNRAAMYERASELLARLGVAIDPRTLVSDLSVAQRQIVEIARALAGRETVLILDEPTSSLDATEVEQLFAILRDLRDQGTGIIFISHRLPEIKEITDRVTVLRDGETVATVPTDSVTTDDLVRLMVGESDFSVAFPAKAQQVGAAVLDVESLSSRGAFSDVSFTIRQGEIVGLSGIEGEGQQAIARALFGLLPVTGTVRLDGEVVRIGSPADAIRRGIVYLSSDRRGEALLMPLSVRENMAVPHLGEWSRAGLVDSSQERQAVGSTIDRLNVRTPSPEQTVDLLSGGNQQKVVIGRWILSEPRVLILDQPTHGVDIATKLDLYRLMRQMADNGAAVLLLSSEETEILGVCDRVLVVSRGRIVDTISGDDLTEERIVGSAVQVERHAGHGAAEGTTTAATGSAVGRFFQKWGSALLVFALVFILGAFTAARTEYFLTTSNLSDLALQIAPLALVAMGQMAVILLGGIDLSVGPLVSLTTAVASHWIVSESTGSILLGVLGAIAVGLGVGLVNGILIRYGKMPDLLATLATYSIVFGLALVVRPSPGGLVSLTFMDEVTRRIGEIPIAALLTLLIVLAGEFFLQRTRYGTALYATGSSREGAFVAGIPIDRVRILAYLFCALTAALAGLIIAARIGSGDPNSGTNFTLMSITAVVVGGTSIFGGRGTLLGTLAGAILVIGMQNALNHLHVSAYYQYIWTGALTLLAVAIYSFREEGSTERFRTWMKRNTGLQPPNR